MNLSGVNALMKSDAIQAHLQAAGEAVAAKASAASGGEAFAAQTHLASFIAITNVYPDSKKAAHRNYKDNTLLKAAGESGLYMSKGAAKQ